MKIAIASGKGGAGKTTIATSLAVIGVERGLPMAYIDCDVEEPNGHLFLRPVLDDRQVVNVLVPQVDEKACRAAGTCGKCGKACQFSAIVCLLDVVVVNPDLCHGCGACVLACPATALTEVPHRIGVVESGHADGIRFVHGVLDVGQAMAIPVVRQVKAAQSDHARVVLLDAPPGTACPAVETARDSDLVLLVVEATPFGFHDFKLAADMVQTLGVRIAAVLNRVDGPVEDIRDWCAQRSIPILAEVSADRKVAEAYARGEMPVHAVSDFRLQMQRLMNGVLQLVAGGSA